MSNGVVVKDARLVVELSCSQEHHIKVLEDSSIIVEEGVITCIGNSCSPPRGLDRIDAKNYIVLPAYIDGHTHTGSIINSLTGRGSSVCNFDGEHVADQKLVSKAAKIACILTLISGGVGIIDMYHYPEEVVKVCRELGLYVATGPGIGIKSVFSTVAFADRFRQDRGVIPLLNILTVDPIRIDIVKEYLEKAK
ncbi:MAG: hypothetical protein DRO13_05630, partial [Thermoprotei archaeon]